MTDAMARGRRESEEDGDEGGRRRGDRVFPMDGVCLPKRTESSGARGMPNGLRRSSPNHAICTI